MKLGKVGNIVTRYLITVVLGVFLSIFYIIFTPLTAYSVYFILKFFYPVVLQANKLIIQSAAIVLIPACIAGSAYYLLLILNLLTPMKLGTRLKAIIFSFITFLIINIIRITVFSYLYLEGFQYFDLAHLFFWYVLSIVFVFLIWIAEIKIYKIKEIPVYTDLKFLLSLTKRGRKKLKKKSVKKR